MPFFQNATGTNFYGPTQMNSQNATGYINDAQDTSHTTGEGSARRRKTRRERRAQNYGNYAQQESNPSQWTSPPNAAIPPSTSASGTAPSPMQVALQLLNQPFAIPFPGNPQFTLVYTPPGGIPNHDFAGLPNNDPTTVSVSSSSSSLDELAHRDTTGASPSQPANPTLSLPPPINTNIPMVPPVHPAPLFITPPNINLSSIVPLPIAPVIPAAGVLMDQAIPVVEALPLAIAQVPAQIPSTSGAQVNIGERLSAPSAMPSAHLSGGSASSTTTLTSQGSQGSRKKSRVSKLLVKMHLKKPELEAAYQ